MRLFLILSALLTCIATPVQAGHGTIHETETQIFIEYCGDASDKSDAPTPGVSEAPTQQLSQAPAVTQPTVAAVQQAAVQVGDQSDGATTSPPGDPGAKALKTAKRSQREQALEIRRQQQAERAARRQRKPGAADNDD